MFELSHTITVTVPSTQGLASKVSPSVLRKRVQDVSKRLASLFGGATATDGLGSYVSDSGELVTELVKLVSAYASEDAYTEHITEIYKLANELKKDYQQESILIAVDNKAYLI